MATAGPERDKHLWVDVTTVLYCITTHFINNIIFTAVLVSFYRVIITSFVRTTRKILSFHLLFCLFSLKILNFFVSKESNFAHVHAFFQFFINSDTYMYTHFSTTYKSAHCRITQPMYGLICFILTIS